MTQQITDVSNATKTEIAKAILLARLTAGPCFKSQLVRLAEKMDVHERSLERAAKELEVETKFKYGSKGREGVIWSLPGGENTESEENQLVTEGLHDTHAFDGLAAITLEKIDQKLDKLLNLQKQSVGENPQNGSRQPGVSAMHALNPRTPHRDDIDLRYVYPPGIHQERDEAGTKKE